MVSTINGFLRDEVNSGFNASSDPGDPDLVFDLSNTEGASGDYYYVVTSSTAAGFPPGVYDEAGTDDSAPIWRVSDGVTSSSSIELFGGAAEVTINNAGAWSYDVIDSSLYDFSSGPLSETIDVFPFLTLGPLSGDNEDTITFNITCFGRGTLIKTIWGEMPVEALSVGDRVLTLDHGYQEIRWIGGRKVSASELETNPRLKPVRIRAGALGRGVPETDLSVSPQHRVLVSSPVALRMFGSSEVLIPANKLLVLPGIDIASEIEGVEYFHMLFDAHQVVWSNGALTESLFTGPEALKAVSPEARQEIATLFPDIVQPDFAPASARPIPRNGKQMKRLAERLAKNAKDAQDMTFPA